MTGKAAKTKNQRLHSLYNSFVYHCKKNKLNINEAIDFMNEYSDSDDGTDADTKEEVVTQNIEMAITKRNVGDGDVDTGQHKRRKCEYEGSSYNRFEALINTSEVNDESVDNQREESVTTIYDDDDMNSNSEMQILEVNKDNTNPRNNKLITLVEEFPSIEQRKSKNAKKITAETEIIGDKVKDTSEKVTNEPKPTSSNKESKIKVPPIYTGRKLNSMKLVALLKQQQIDDYIVKILPNNEKIIKCADLKSHQYVCEQLKENNVGGHTFTAKHERPTVLLAKGIHHAYEDKEVQEEIERIYALKTKVRQFGTVKSNKESNKLNAKVISFENGVTMKEILSIKYLFNHVISWEKLRKSEIIQCLNCLRFGHIARNCLNSYRCIKCDQEHERDQCQRDKTSENTEEDTVNSGGAYCVNCQQFGHPANYKGCSVYKKVIEARNKQREAKQMLNFEKREARKFAQSSVMNAMRKETSFADIVKRNQPDNSENIKKTSDWMSFMQDESNNLFGLTLTETMRQVNIFMESYVKISKKEEKQVAFITFLMNLCQG